jgi:hypothetical protein
MTSSRTVIEQTALTARRLCTIAWALPCSLVGAGFGLLMLLAGGSVRRVGWTLECALSLRLQSALIVRKLPFAAITLGHVILGTSHSQLARLRPHEQVHVRQYERWGILFFLAYPLASLIAWMKGGCPYRDNLYEREAERGAHANVKQAH